MIDFYPLEELIHNYTEKFHVLYDKNKIENDEFYRIRIKYEQENIKMLDKERYTNIELLQYVKVIEDSYILKVINNLIK